jgi:cell division protein FtsZ
MPAADPDESLLIGDTSNNPLFNFEVKGVALENLEEEKQEQDEHLRRSQERLSNLKTLGTKLRSPQAVSDLESVPAYRRRGIKLDAVAHSSENNFSRYVLTENLESNTLEIRTGNSFLHDNVD